MPIVLHGSFQGTNFGDTLLLRLFADHVRRLGVHDVLTTNASGHAAAYARVRRISRSRALLRRYPLIFCGGGYFGEPPYNLTRWRFDLWRRHLAIALPAALCRTPTAVLGVGAGPLTSRWVRGPTKYVFRHAMICALRDSESVEFSRNQLDTPAIEVADAVLGCSKEYLLRIAEAPPQHDRQPVDHLYARRMLVHIPGGGNDLPERLALAEQIVNTARDIPDVTLVLVTDTAPGVRPDFFEWFASLEPGRVEYVPFTDPSALLRQISRAQGVITTKLHVGICAAVLEKLVLSLPRHPKTLRLYRQLARTDACIPLNAPSGAIRARLEAILHGNCTPIRVPQSLCEAAGKIWELLPRVLKHSGGRSS